MAGTGHVDSDSDYGSDILTDLVYLVYGPEQVRSWWKQSEKHGEQGRSENQGRGRGLDGVLDWSQNRGLKDGNKKRREDLGFFLKSIM